MKADIYHAGMNPDRRKANHHKFVRDELQVRAKNSLYFLSVMFEFSFNMLMLSFFVTQMVRVVVESVSDYVTNFC